MSKGKARLARVVGVPGAVLMGLGSILGTGIFVSIGIAAGIAGSSVVLAVLLAAVVATCNGLSSAQLAASHPVSGGTYEYGYRYLNAQLGFTAGWMFLCAKSASAATAALGFAGYVLAAFGSANAQLRSLIAVLAVALLTITVASGMQRSNRTNAAIVGLTLLALLSFVVFGFEELLASSSRNGPALFSPISFSEKTQLSDLLHATALMFVAYTGYGRVATLGEEIRNPERNIPRAIVFTLLFSMVLYVAVTFVAVRSVGPAALSRATLSAAAPLEVAARSFATPGVPLLVSLGAMTAMLGVLLNLVLGLSRILLAMARRGDMPSGLAQISKDQSSPRRAVFVIGALIAVITLVFRIELAWSFSAFSVLVYYALTNLAALRLPRSQRRYPRWVAASGLAFCLGLAFWVEPFVWAFGLLLIALGLGCQTVSRLARRSA